MRPIFVCLLTQQLQAHNKATAQHNKKPAAQALWPFTSAQKRHSPPRPCLLFLLAMHGCMAPRPGHAGTPHLLLANFCTTPRSLRHARCTINFCKLFSPAGQETNPQHSVNSPDLQKPIHANNDPSCTLLPASGNHAPILQPTRPACSPMPSLRCPADKPRAQRSIAAPDASPEQPEQLPFLP